MMLPSLPTWRARGKARSYSRPPLISPSNVFKSFATGKTRTRRRRFYRDPAVTGPCAGNAVQLWGKELSYNNILDLNSAFELVREFTEPTAVIIKHNNPCGCACASSLLEAYKKALEGDPISAFGGIVALNREVDPETAEEMSKLYLEAIIAPGYQEDAPCYPQEKG